MNVGYEPYANETAKDEGFEAIGMTEKTFYPYDADVANAAWGSLLDFFGKYLRALPKRTRPRSSALIAACRAHPPACLYTSPPARSLKEDYETSPRDEDAVPDSESVHLSSLGI